MAHGALQLVTASSRHSLADRDQLSWGLAAGLRRRRASPPAISPTMRAVPARPSAMFTDDWLAADESLTFVDGDFEADALPVVGALALASSATAGVSFKVGTGCSGAVPSSIQRTTSPLE